MDPKFPMRNTTLCYLEQDDAYLMLHRVTKKNDLNHDKWIGVGGKFEPFESPEDCLLREVQEETGLTLTSYRCRGVVTFLLGELTEYMFLYTADAWTGTLVKDAARNEGILEWVPKEQVEQLPIWEGDKIFFKVKLLQMLKRIVPPMSNEVITLVKDTSLSRIIALQEVIWAGQAFMKGSHGIHGAIWPLFFTGVYYLVFSGLLTLGLGWLERKLDYFKA